MCQGLHYRVGDIVSLQDEEDGALYFAQVRGLLEDQYCQKKAVLTWLLPSQNTPLGGRFDPGTYILGPEEELPRKLEAMEFVCHAPSEYFRNCTTPYPVFNRRREASYIWTRARSRDTATTTTTLNNKPTMNGTSSSSES
ncbi:GATAD1 [Cordylochernes scorpioides]|uniref:GATAD1 n=1 Tax=Cordylochernes scorpioides TaxID=51811 RepID=A0ABY6K354_9ARAC|nr:GATAD1 [Cordylochernes scorpioides]